MLKEQKTLLVWEKLEFGVFGDQYVGLPENAVDLHPYLNPPKPIFLSLQQTVGFGWLIG